MSGRTAVLAVALAAALAASACGRRDGLGDLPTFPGATVVGRTSFEDAAFGFPAARWEQVELRTTARFEQVRDFYRGVTVRDQAAVFETEVPKHRGRLYARYLSDRPRRTFYVVTVEERPATRDVSILLRRGIAR